MQQCNIVDEDPWVRIPALPNNKKVKKLFEKMSRYVECKPKGKNEKAI